MESPAYFTAHLFTATILESSQPLTDEEKKLVDDARHFAKKNGRAIARELADLAVFPGEEKPVSVFMAGSPGAGKTEASKELLKKLGDSVLRIDPDDLRSRFPGYTGANSWVFQGGVSLLVEKLLDLALSQKQSFLLDGTLSSYTVAERNIERSLKKGRHVQILYVYQEPQFAWEFVQARENKEGRNIRPEHFVKQYFEARQVVEALKKKFGQELIVDLLIKNIDGSGRLYRANVDQITSHVPEKYTHEQVLEITSEGAAR
ncbi:MAG: zeta toxin family protein [Ramlibacter sp.]|nr:zeta toxin family protein [Ramlibacter sp.]